MTGSLPLSFGFELIDDLRIIPPEKKSELLDSPCLLSDCRPWGWELNRKGSMLVEVAREAVSENALGEVMEY